MRAPAVALVALLLAGCSSGSTPQAEPSSHAPSTSPTPTKKAPAKPTPSKKPTPKPTTPPPVTGDVLTTAGSVLAPVSGGEPKTVGQGASCSAVFADVTRPTCAAVKMDGGSLLWVTGRESGAGVVRLFVQQQGGTYVEKYAGSDTTASWKSVQVYATPLTGHGTDGLVVLVRQRDDSATYELLTWVAGGPLVRRAHRDPIADGRLAPRSGGLDEYALAIDGSFVKRRVAWDGRSFRLSSGVRSATAPGR